MKINIKNQLKQKGISRYELAKRINITYPTMTTIFKGESSSIRLDVLENLCCELNCTPNDILKPDTSQLERIMSYYHSINQNMKSDDE